MYLQPGLPTQGGADFNLNLAFNFVRIYLRSILQLTHRYLPQNGSDFFINGASFVPPTVPVLLQIISGANSAQDLLPSGSVYALPSNSSIELTFPATAAAPGAPHPFHLHGVSPLSAHANRCLDAHSAIFIPARLRCRTQRR